MRKIVTVSSIFLSVVFLSGCGQQLVELQTQPMESVSIEEQSTQPVPITPPVNPVPSNWNMYQNTKYKYVFEYPTNFELNAEIDSRDVSLVDKEDSILIVNLTTDGVVIDDNFGKCPQGKLVKSLAVDNQNIEICQGDNKRSDFYTFISRDLKNTNDDIFIEIAGDINKQQQIQTFFEQFVSSFKFTK